MHFVQLRENAPYAAYAARHDFQHRNRVPVIVPITLASLLHYDVGKALSIKRRVLIDLPTRVHASPTVRYV